jgi:DNA-binding NtrC family response regulator
MTDITRHVMHIDDDPVTTRVVAAKLRAHGIESLELNDPRKALAHLLDHQRRVVLLDIDMPHQNGLDLLREIKRFDGGIHVIMLTGIVTQAMVLQSLRWGATECHFKPVTDAAPLVAAIERAFESIARFHNTLHELTKLRRRESALSESFGSAAASFSPPTPVTYS